MSAAEVLAPPSPRPTLTLFQGGRSAREDVYLGGPIVIGADGAVNVRLDSFELEASSPPPWSQPHAIAPKVEADIHALASYCAGLRRRDEYLGMVRSVVIEHFAPPPQESKGSAPPWTDCGDPACPFGCAPLIAARVEAEHKAKVATTRRVQGGATSWFADMFGTGADRVSAEEAAGSRKWKRRSRAEEHDIVRVVWPCSDVERQCAEAMLKDHPVRRCYLRWSDRAQKDTRDEWLSQVWIELLKPTALIARRMRGKSVAVRVSNAVNNAQKRMWKENRTEKTLFIHEDEDNRRTTAPKSTYE